MNNNILIIYNKIKNIFLPQWLKLGFTIKLIYLGGSYLNRTNTEVSDYDIVVVCETLPEHQIYQKIEFNNIICSVFFHDQKYYINPLSSPCYYGSGLIDFLHCDSSNNSNIIYYQDLEWLKQFINLVIKNKSFLISDYYHKSSLIREKYIKHKEFCKELYHCVDALFLKYNYTNLPLLISIKYQKNLDLLMQLLLYWKEQ